MTALTVAAVLYGLGLACWLAVFEDDDRAGRRAALNVAPLWPLLIAVAIAMRAAQALRERRR